MVFGGTVTDIDQKVITIFNGRPYRYTNSGKLVRISFMEMAKETPGMVLHKQHRRWDKEDGF